jgi:hypothetical protein
MLSHRKSPWTTLDRSLPGGRCFCSQSTTLSIASIRPASTSPRYCFDHRATWRSTKLPVSVIGKPDVFGLEIVKPGDGLIHRIEAVEAMFRAQPRKLRLPENSSRDHVHHEEGGADNAVVLAQAVHPRDRKALAPERRHHSKLAIDRMCSGKQFPRRLAAKDVGAARLSMR